MNSRTLVTLAMAATLSLTVLSGTAVAHWYDANPVGEPDKHIDGASTITAGSYNGESGFWVEFTRYTYGDTSPLYFPVKEGFANIETAYCAAPESWGANGDAPVDCHAPPDGAAGGGQDALYDGNVSPHAQGLRIPQDRQEFASYLSAATGAFNNGQGGGINQNQAVAGSRYGQVTDEKQFDAATARMYVFQFAAVANGFAANTIDGMAKGAKAFYGMSPASQEFMQVAAVYKGDLAGNASNYNNNALKALLQRKAPGLANRNNVGNTDVETLAAIAAALDQDLITLDDIAASGTIAGANNTANYAKAIDMVSSGSFALKLADYDRATLVAGQGNGNLNANAGNAGFNAPGAGVNRNPQSLGEYYSALGIQPNPSHAARLAATDPVYRKILELHDINGVGRIYGEGEAKNFVNSMRCFMSMLQDGDRTIANVDPHDKNHLAMFDTNNDGVVNDAEAANGLQKTKIFADAVAADAKDQTGGIAPGGVSCVAVALPPPPPPPVFVPQPPPTPKPAPVGY